MKAILAAASSLCTLCFCLAMASAQNSPSIQYLQEKAREGEIVAPIAGLSRSHLHDSFNEIHNGHLHHAIDIMEPRATPIRAAVTGKIQKLFYSTGGGKTIYEFDEGQRFCYYYAHLDNYAERLHDGYPVKKGDIIGYVGSTGNASPDAPHLHFAIYRLDSSRRWWKGFPIDPYPILFQLSNSSEQATQDVNNP